MQSLITAAINPAAAGVVATRRSFLVLGGPPPAIPSLDLSGTPGPQVAGIILLGPVPAAELQDALDKLADPAVPVADFGGNSELRRDFAAARLDDASARAMRASFEPIWRRLDDIPFKAEHGAAAELTILRLAYSRDVAITASYAPTSQRLVEYSLLGPAPGVRNQLETLAALELLHRRHFTRTNLCAKCESARLHVYEACARCGGSDLFDEDLIHHYRCGCQDVESRFKKDDFLVCPKCHKALHHIGVDYGKPGKVVSCRTCHAVDSEPAIRFACLDCGTVTPADEAKTLDWYHYDLAQDGVRAMRLGRLPQFEIAPFLQRRTTTYSPAEFNLLASQELKISQRFKRAFAVARFTVLNFDEILRAKGPVATEAGSKRIVDAVVAELRSCDFVGMGTMRSAVIGFPDTSAKQVNVIIDRIRRTIDATVASHLELEIEVAEGEAIKDFLAGG